MTTPITTAQTDETDDFRPIAGWVDGLNGYLQNPILVLTNQQCIRLRRCAYKLLTRVNSMDPTSNPDAVQILNFVSEEVTRQQEEILENTPVELADAARKLISQVRSMINGTLFSGPSCQNYTSFMHGHMSNTDVQSLLAEFRPFLELANDIANRPQKVLETKIDSMSAKLDKQSREAQVQIDILTEQLKDTKLSLENSKTALEQSSKSLAISDAKLLQAQYQNLAYDLISKVEDGYAAENQTCMTMKEGCYIHHRYNLQEVETAFAITPTSTQSGVQQFVNMIKAVKDQRLPSGHSSPDLQKKVKLSEMREILTKHFKLDDNAKMYYDKAILYALKRLQRAEQTQYVRKPEDVTVETIMNLF